MKIRDLSKIERPREKLIAIGVVGSTNGSDLPAIVKSIKKGKLKGLARIAVIISDKKDSGILKKAKHYKIEHYYLDPKGMERTDYDKKIAEKLDKYNVQLIALIGYMRLFSSWFVKRYKNKIMNVHPSLLPSFLVLIEASIKLYWITDVRFPVAHYSL